MDFTLASTEGEHVISFRVANRGWGHNVAPRIGTTDRDRWRLVGPLAVDVDDADGVDGAADGGGDAVGTLEPIEEIDSDETLADAGVDDETNGEPAGGAGGLDAPDDEVDAPSGAWRVHPLGWITGGLLVLAVLYHTVLDTKYLIGNLEPLHWVALVVVFLLSFWSDGLNGLRVGLEVIPSITKPIAAFLAWFVFFVQFFNVVTRYGTRYVDADILIGEATSLAWQSFAALFLLGASYGIRDGVNPRIDFWWANFSDKRKAWIDFVLHAFLFLPFCFMAIRILQPYAAISLGRKRDGSWPSGARVWETWEQSSDADQLPVGPVKALLLVGFILVALQVVAELIKTGFVIANRPRYGFEKPSGEAPQRIE